mmetsp:Transcript_30683/g.86761  ORF Transcript_30683/g.86761 Transcript_30683/m.86761 type:complete len:605 (+) Transcript_30683:309-2123(+)
MSTPGNITMPLSPSAAPITVELLAAQQKSIQEALDTAWVIVGSMFVVFMQAGFAFLEAGSVRAKNLKNILLKNVMDTCVGSIMWYVVGYAFAHGAGNPFIGTSGFFLSDIPVPSVEFAGWLYSNAFAATAATIVSGAMAERCRIEAYLIYTCVITGFVYPTSSHWVNSSVGWLNQHSSHLPFVYTNGLLDFAGSGTVHLVGGMCALVGASWSGPRKGRFNPDGTVNPMPGHSSVMATMGALILWTGWYGFNSVSTQAAVGHMETAALTVVNTTVSAAVAGCTTLLVYHSIYRSTDIIPCINGILAGLVASSSTCAYVAPYGAFVIGLMAGATYAGTSWLMLRFNIDDPVDAVAVHLANGILGLLMAGLFAMPEALVKAGYTSSSSCGAFYGCGGAQFGVQVVGVAVLSAWSFAMSTLIFAPMNRFGVLRVSTSQEVEGLDVTFHGGRAYNLGTHAATLSGVGSQPPPTNFMASRTSIGGSIQGATNYNEVVSNAQLHRSQRPGGAMHSQGLGPVRMPSDCGKNKTEQQSRRCSAANADPESVVLAIAPGSSEAPQQGNSIEMSSPAGHHQQSSGVTPDNSAHGGHAMAGHRIRQPLSRTRESQQ